MTTPNANSIRERLRGVLSEMREQSHLANHFGDVSLSFDEEMEQIREFIEDAGEYGIAYESIVSALEEVPFVLSGKAAVNLLEVGLLLGYKTDKQSDQPYDRRRRE
jgi:hypothetical protein